MEKKIDLVVVGSLITDLISYADRIPKIGETIEGNDFQMGFGGKGANQCIAASRLGAKCHFVGKLGNDANGESYIKNMRSEGVNVDAIEMEKNAPTGVASIMVGQNGENIILIVPGANKLVTPDYVSTFGDGVIQKAKVLLLQLEIPIESSLMALRLASKYGTTSIFNVAPAVPNIPKELFHLCDILCLNESEAELITGLPKISSRDDAVKAINQLLKEFNCNSVILTLGSEGALLWDKAAEKFFHASAPAVKAVDTTGAGDCFVGTLAYCIVRGDSLETSLRRAVLNASDSVLRKGTQQSFPRKLM